MVIHGTSRGRGHANLRDGDSEARPFMPTLYDPPIRADLVARVKAEIAAGAYDTPERFEAAFMAMLDQEKRN